MWAGSEVDKRKVCPPLILIERKGGLVKIAIVWTQGRFQGQRKCSFHGHFDMDLTSPSSSSPVVACLSRKHGHVVPHV